MKGKKCKGSSCECENCMTERVERIKSLGFSVDSAKIYAEYTKGMDKE